MKLDMSVKEDFCLEISYRMTDKEFFLSELHFFGTKPLRFNRSKADTGFIVHRELLIQMPFFN